MKVSKKKKQQRRDFAYQAPFKCPYCDNLEYHFHTLENLMKMYPLKSLTEQLSGDTVEK